jgi:hypothetical protein
VVSRRSLSSAQNAIALTGISHPRKKWRIKMKTKIVEITKTEAKIAMVRMDFGAVIILIMALVIFFLIDTLSGYLLILGYVTIGFLLISAAMLMGVSILSKSDIQALNIIGWPTKKYILKEVKDE